MTVVTLLFHANAFLFLHDEDVEKLAHEESSTSEEEGWKFVSKSDFTDVWKKTVENQHLHLVKVCALIHSNSLNHPLSTCI